MSASASSANPSDTAANEQGNPMWQLVTEWVKVDEEQDVLQEMLDGLAAKGITKPFQLEKAPDALLERIFPLESHARHYLTAVHVRDEQRKWENQTSASTDPLAGAVRGWVREARAARHSRKRGKDDDFFTDDETETKKFNRKEALEQYHLDQVPSERMPKLEKMGQVAKRGVRGVAGHGQFLVPGTVNEYTPHLDKGAGQAASRLQDPRALGGGVLGEGSNAARCARP